MRYGNSSLRMQVAAAQLDRGPCRDGAPRDRSCARARNWSAPGRSRAPLPAASCGSSPESARTRSRRCGTARRSRVTGLPSCNGERPAYAPTSSSARILSARIVPSLSNATSTSKMRSGPCMSPPRMFSSRSSIKRTGMPRRAREIADEHGVLDAALDAVAAADVDVVVHAHRVAGQPQRARELVGDTSASGSTPRRRVSPVPRPTARRRRTSRSARSSCVPTSRAAQACARRSRTPSRPAPRRSAGGRSRWSRAPGARAGCRA